MVSSNCREYSMKSGVYKVSDLPNELVGSLALKGEHVLFDQARGGTYHFYEVDLIKRIESERQLIEVIRSPVHGHYLVLDGEIQIASTDEHEYHGAFAQESLAFLKTRSPKRNYTAMVFGGGDGCLARELLKTERFQSIEIIDWDKDVLNMFSDGEMAEIFNTKHVFASDAVKVFSEDFRGYQFENLGDSVDILYFDLTDEAVYDPGWADQTVRLLNYFVAEQKQEIVLAVQLGGRFRNEPTQNLKLLLAAIEEKFPEQNLALTHEEICFYIPSYSTYWALGFIGISYK